MKEFSTLMEELTAQAATQPRPIRAMVELTYGCNLRCVHCYNPTHQARQEISTENYFKILDDLAENGCLWVGFTGGELFTRADTFRILQYARSLGLVMTIVTNATRITEEVADELFVLQPYQIDVSLYGASREVYEAVTRVPGSYDAFIGGLDRLSARKLPVLLKLVLMTLNVGETEAMHQFAIQRGLSFKVSTEIHPIVDGRTDPLAYRLSPDQAFAVWRSFSGEQQLAAKPGGESAVEAGCGGAGQLFDCLCGKSSAAVTPYGKMNLCVSIQHPQYDLLQGNVAAGWKTLVQSTRLSPGPQYECSGCRLAIDCTRGTSDSWLEHGIFDAGCIPHFREIAKRKERFLNLQSTEDKPHG